MAHFPFDSVSVIDLGRGDVVDTIPVDGAPRGVAVSPDEKRLYVTQFFADSVAAIVL